MAFNLRNRSLLNMQDFNPRDIRFLLDLSAELKRAKYAGNEVAKLNGKNIALIFEKTSTRTRCAFEVAVHDQGGHVTYIDSSSSQLGRKESLKDTARVLGRLYEHGRRPRPVFARAGVEWPDRRISSDPGTGRSIDHGRIRRETIV